MSTSHDLCLPPSKRLKLSKQNKVIRTQQTKLAIDNNTLGIRVPRFPFLKLPPELRLKIYSYLFPNKPVTGRHKQRLRHGGESCCTAILRTNHLIYDEASELLYGSVQFRVTFACCGCNAAFMRTSLNCVKNHRQAMWQALAKVRDLRVDIRPIPSYQIEPVCHVQDLLADLVNGLTDNGRLRRLSIRVSPTDAMEDFDDLFWDLAPDELDEFKRFELYGDDKDAQETRLLPDNEYGAFFIEPFFQLRNSSIISVNLDLKGVPPTILRKLEEILQATMTINAAATSIWPLRDAWQSMLNLINHVGPTLISNQAHRIEHLSKNMLFARLRGSVHHYVSAQQNALAILGNTKYRTSHGLRGDSRAARAETRERMKDFEIEARRLHQIATSQSASHEQSTFSLPRRLEQELGEYTESSPSSSVEEISDSETDIDEDE
ncbi:MAG: hypothetical protein M1820_008717 [Bogoriella megaspora]|nr:MAG: hypothetical protein M1820_008717 [Bogoriella megaspora]